MNWTGFCCLLGPSWWCEDIRGQPFLLCYPGTACGLLMACLLCAFPALSQAGTPCPALGLRLALPWEEVGFELHFKGKAMAIQMCQRLVGMLPPGCLLPHSTSPPRDKHCDSTSPCSLPPTGTSLSTSIFQKAFLVLYTVQKYTQVLRIHRHINVVYL